ncbi:MAG: glycoside hydrolase family 13 protein [Bacteroidales bacterium]|nr:glycoside hydrolase family 13 protein [Bacteroidales bacterium]
MIQLKALLTLYIVLFSFLFAEAQIQRVEPPNWWAGMHNPTLQLMVYAADIADDRVVFDYPGVHLVSIEKVENPNYLFINLTIDDHTLPGTFTIEFINSDSTISTYDYTLEEREPGSADRDGFDNSDVMYLLMPDRFANGDPENDIVPGMREEVVDRTDKTGLHGGDLRGIINHLDYIQEMGFTAVWFNPFLENNMDRSSYHGYSTTDFYKVDPRYGTNEQFRELTSIAAEMDIKIIMDMIFNHIGSRHWWMEDLPTEDWINGFHDFTISNHVHTVNQDAYASEYDRKGMVDGWFVPSMPDLNQRNKFLANYLIQNSIWWIEYAGLAGIRMDTYPYPDKDMMAAWNKRVLKEYPDFNIVGEEWSLNPGLVSYWQKGQTNHDGYDGEIPSMMDFPLQSALSESLTEEEEGWNTGWKKLYDALSNDFLYPDPYNLVIFPDNHDMPRFFMQVGMDTDLYKLGITYILTTRGIPQIFYGSEVLMTHKESNHHGHIRKDFPGGWAGDNVNAFAGQGLTEDQQEIQDFFRKLLNWRKQHAVIHTGRLIHYVPEDGVYVYGRYNDQKRVMVLLNKTGEKAELDPVRFRELIRQSTSGTDVITGAEVDLTGKIIVPAKTGLVLELK